MIKYLMILCALGTAALSMPLTQKSLADEVSYVTRIEGSVSFEKRHSVILLSWPSSEAQVYWSVVVHAGPYRYELDQPFALGSQYAPDAVTLDGVVIHEGSRISLQGRVESVTRDYSILSQVQDVNLVMDYSYVNKNARYFGWACHTPGAPLENPASNQAHVYVNVWLASQDDQGGAYRLRVLSDAGQPDPKQLKQVAYLDSVSLDSRGDQIIFGGSSNAISAQLVIDGSTGRMSDLPATLRLSRIYVGFEENFPLETQVQLQCTRTRL